MGESDRLQQLHQQRTKIAEHLQWLDQEIAKATNAEAPPRPNLKLRVPAPASPRPVQLESNNPSPGVTANPEAVLEEWVETSETDASPISKTGCWLIFAGLAVAGVLALGTFIYFYYDLNTDEPVQTSHVTNG